MKVYYNVLSQYYPARKTKTSTKKSRIKTELGLNDRLLSFLKRLTQEMALCKVTAGRLLKLRLYKNKSCSLFETKFSGS